MLRKKALMCIHGSSYKIHDCRENPAVVRFMGAKASIHLVIYQLTRKWAKASTGSEARLYNPYCLCLQPIVRPLGPQPKWSRMSQNSVSNQTPTIEAHESVQVISYSTHNTFQSQELCELAGNKIRPPCWSHNKEQCSHFCTKETTDYE